MRTSGDPARRRVPARFASANRQDIVSARQFSVSNGAVTTAAAYNVRMGNERASLYAGGAIGALLPLAVAAILVPLREDMVVANVALVLVLVVVLAAVTGGWKAGALSALVTTLTFDFWFTKPYLSLKIESADDVETALLLLAVGVCVGLIASRTRFARHAADATRSETTRIHRVAELSARGAEPGDILLAAQRELLGLLSLEDCHFEPGLDWRYLPRIERNGAITGTEVRHYAHARDELELPRDGVELPVWSRGQTVGQFVLLPTPGEGISLEQRIVAVAIADQVGAALVTQN